MPDLFVLEEVRAAAFKDDFAGFQDIGSSGDRKGLLGVLLGHGLIGIASPYVVERTGIALSMLEFDWQELLLIPGLVVLASIVGFLPAIAAYRTDVAKALAGSR